MRLMPIKDLSILVSSCENIKINYNQNYILIEIPTGDIRTHFLSKSCVFCNNDDNDILHFKNMYVCRKCVEKLNKAMETGDYYY